MTEFGTCNLPKRPRRGDEPIEKDAKAREPSMLDELKRPICYALAGYRYRSDDVGCDV